MMTHFELCKKTAERFIKNSGNNVALYDYQNYDSGEFPDVLIYGNSTILFEIKMTKQDFIADDNKPCRIKYKLKGK